MIPYPGLSEVFQDHPINAISRACRVRGTFMRFGVLTSVLVFFVVGGEVLLDQLAIGSASAVFMVGTELVIAGACIGLFAIIAALGLAISIVLEDDSSITDKPAVIKLELVELNPKRMR
jgi:hypothetical protein